MLEQRIASSRKHLSNVVSLAEAWDLEYQIGVQTQERVGTQLAETTAPDEELDELRPLLAVDKTELEQDIARLLRQIVLLKP